MLLSPQHFQLTAARAEMLGQYTRLIASPFCWGVRRLAVDMKLVPSGTFRILDLEAVMPDGAVVSHNPGMGELSVDLTGTQVADFPVYLLLPARSAPGVKGSLPRFEAFEGEPAADENTGEGELRTQMLRPRLSLMAGEEPAPKFESMQIGCMHFEDDTWVLTDYIAPTMAVSAHSPLGNLCALVAKRLREKGMSISDRVQAQSASTDSAMILENRLRMHALISRLPVLEALLATECAHPLALYLELCAIAGQLATLGASMMPPAFPPYRHSDPRTSFQAVSAFSNRMMDEGVPETYRTFPFHLSEGVYTLFFDPEWFDRRLVLGMRVPTGASDKDIIAWANGALIGSESIIGSMRDKRIRAPNRQYVDQDPELIAARGVLLFSLDADHDFIRKGEKLQVLNFGEIARSGSPLEIVLFVKNRF